MTVVVPITDRAEVAAIGLGELLDAKLEAAYNASPECTATEILDFALSGELPGCRIPATSYEEAKAAIGFDVEEEVREAMLQALPPTVELDESVVTGTLGTEEVDTVRTLLRDGYVFTQDDLLELVEEQGGEDMLDLFDDARGYMRDGFVFTEGDAEEAAGNDLEQFETVRGYVGTARSFALVVVLPLLLLVAIVGFLGGRSWWTRLAWAGVPLVVGGLIVATASGAVAGPLMDYTDPFVQDVDAPQTVVDKVAQVRDELVRTFVNPIAIQAAVLAVLGLAAIVGGVIMARRRDATWEPSSG